MGAGIGFAFAAMANLIVEAVDPTETGVATGMNTIMRTVGGSLGGQISATIVSAHVIAGSHIAKETGYTQAFLLSALVMVLAFGATLLVPVRARMHTRLAA
jgi:MFS family permease